MSNKVQKANVQDIFELNAIQKGMLYQFLKEEEDNLYHVQLSFEITGVLEIEKLKESFGILQANNEALRSVFSWEQVSKPLQIVLKECPFNFTYSDISQRPADTISDLLEEYFANDLVRFDLRNLPFRVLLVKTASSVYILTITYHHILYDGWSNGILLKELFSYYHQLTQNRPAVNETKPSFKSVYQVGRAKADPSESASYWKEYLADYTIKSLFLRHHRADANKGVVRRQLFTTAIGGLEAFAIEHKVTKASVIYAAFGILLQKYMHSSDVVFGTTVSNRDSSIVGADKILGNFINILPLRLKTAHNESFSEIVESLHKSTIVRNQYNGTTYQDIRNFLDLKLRDDLYDAVVVIENYPLYQDSGRQGHFNLKLRSVYENTSIPIVITVFFKDNLEIEFMYKSKLINDVLAKSLAHNFILAIRKIVENCREGVSSITLSASEEEQQLLNDFNSTTRAYPSNQTIIDLFDEQVKKTPGNVAQEFKERVWHYQRLKEVSDKIAFALCENLSVKRGSLVGLLLEREEYLVPVILGILKAGAAYVPIDPNYPVDRIRMIIEDAQLQTLVTRRRCMPASIETMVEIVIDLDRDLQAIEALPACEPRATIDGKSPAYVIYTSGSTGRPKGVMIAHRALLNYIRWAAEKYVGKQKATFALCTSIGFDLTITSIFTPIVTGNKIVVFSEDDRGQVIESVIVNKDIDVVKLTPSHLKIALDIRRLDLPLPAGIRKFIVGGEELTTQMSKEVYDACHANVEIYNEYGPTEATVGCMIYQFDPLDITTTVPLGNPIENTHIYILDKSLRQVPAGVAGEIYIAGEGLSMGYLNNVPLTEQKFVDNPFVRNERMYRTGDRAVRCFNGSVLFLGRTDDQVKINGFRIEPGDIESILSGYEPVEEAVVVAKEGKNDRYLVAYYVSAGEMEEGELRSYLVSRLPEYMIPAFFVRLEKLPLTNNNKLDKNALPDPEEKVRATYIAPSTYTEEGLARIWSEVLNLDMKRISVEDSFLELGGHSLKVIIMLNRIFKTFNVKIPINEVFQHPDIRSLGLYIEEIEKSAYSPVEKAPVKEYYEVSSAQKRLYFLHEIDRTSTAYNGGFVVRLEGELDPERINRVFHQLIGRHEILRTSFLFVDGKPVQKVAPEIDFKLAYFSTNEEHVLSIIKDFTRPFDLTRAPLMRGGLIEFSHRKYILIVDTHHIIGDERSQEILIKDFVTLYNQQELPALQLQYKDYAEWQQNAVAQNETSAAAKFWADEFREDVDVLELPQDYRRPVVKSYHGNSLSFTLDDGITNGLRSVAQKEGVTMFMLLFSVYNVLLAKLSNQEDIIVGVSSTGRSHPDLENIAGLFINTLPVRNLVDGNSSFRQFLSVAKSKILACFHNQAYPYELLIEDLNVKRDTSRNPLFDVMFSYKNGDEKFEIPDLTVQPFIKESSTSKFDMTMSAHERVNQICFEVEYASQLFAKDTISRFIDYFKAVASTVVSDSDILISDIEILSQQERRQVVYDFNNTQADYPRILTIIDLFEAQVRKSPDRVALVYNEQKLTYGELNERADDVAGLLKVNGVKEASVVGLMIERSIEMMVSLIGILKTGATYLPLDPSHPVDRVRTMLLESKAVALLTEGSNKDIYHRDTHTIDIFDDKGNVEEADYSPVRFSPDNIAYIIYTSGSTGNPKGVMITHQTVINLIYSQQAFFRVNENDNILQFSPLYFDASVEQIWLALLNGACLVLVGKDIINDRDRFNEYLIAHRVTHLHATPSYLERMHLNDIPGLKRIISGGEECRHQLAERYCRDYEFYNEYGPTETTVTSIISKVGEDQLKARLLPIGRPVNNTFAYILGKNKDPLPVGTKGELYIGGEGLAKGYVNDEVLTRQKFIKNPFVSTGSMYKTGDLARWLPDGSIQYLGRTDNQIKLRGYRIELSEVEIRLSKHESITECVVLLKEDKQDKFLVAYYVASCPLQAGELRSFLLRSVPDYMIPSYFVHLDTLPLTFNGKLDKKSLPEPVIDISNYARPVNELQKELVGIWSRVLNIEVEKISVNTNFFDMGGNSLKLIQLKSMINEHFGTDLSTGNMFEFPVISLVADYLSKTGKEELDKTYDGVDAGMDQMKGTISALNRIRN